jgi:hypothetical protein
LKSCKRNKQRRGMNFVLRSQDPARSRGLRITACVYDGCGFRSCVLSLWPKRNIKTKLQINTSPADGINTMLPAVAVTHQKVVRENLFWFFRPTCRSLLLSCMQFHLLVQTKNSHLQYVHS